LSDDVLLERFNSGDAIAIIKIGRHFSRVRNLIEEAGLLHRAGYLERVSLFIKAQKIGLKRLKCQIRKVPYDTEYHYPF